MPIECRCAPERGRARARPHPHAILRQRIEINQAGLGQRRQMLGEQPVEQIAATNPEVRQRVIVHRHATTQPAIDIMAVAQPLQDARAADAVAGGIEPQCQQKPRRRRRMTRPLAPSLDPILKLAQVESLDIRPDHTHRMVFPDQAFDIHCAQLDLVTLRLTQARCCERRRIGLLLRLRRQFPEQFIASHHRLPRINDRKGITLDAPPPILTIQAHERFTPSEVRA